MKIYDLKDLKKETGMNGAAMSKLVKDGLISGTRKGNMFLMDELQYKEACNIIVTPKFERPESPFDMAKVNEIRKDIAGIKASIKRMEAQYQVGIQKIINLTEALMVLNKRKEEVCKPKLGDVIVKRMHESKGEL